MKIRYVKIEDLTTVDNWPIITQYSGLTLLRDGVYPTPLMGEEQQKLVAALPRDNEVIKVFKIISGMDPLPPRN